MPTVLLPKLTIVPLLASVLFARKVLSVTSIRPVLLKLPLAAIAVRLRPCCRRRAPELENSVLSSDWIALATVLPWIVELAPIR